MHNFYKRKRYTFVLFIFIFFLFPFSLSFAEDQNQNEIFQYQFPEFQTTIHAKPEGGMWNSPSTWEESRIPDENDYVEINGEVRVYGPRYADEKREVFIKGVYLKENAKLKISYGEVKLYPEEFFLTENDTEVYLSLFSADKNINYGDVSAFFLNRDNAELNNQGNISTIYISSGNYIFHSENEIPTVSIDEGSYITLSKSLYIDTLKMYGTTEISFSNENDNDFFVKKIIGGDYTQERIIHGDIFLLGNDALRIGHIQTNNLTIKQGADIHLFCNNQIIDAPVILENESHIYPPGQYSCGSWSEGDFYPLFKQSLYVSQNASIERRTKYDLKGKLTNYGSVYSGVFHGDVENYNSIYYLLYDRPVEKIYLGESDIPRTLSGLENYEIWIQNGEVVLTHPFYVKKLIGTGRDGVIPTISFNSQDHAHIYIMESIQGFDNVNGNPYIDIQGTIHFVGNNPHSIRGNVKANLVIVEDGTGLSVNKLIAPLVIEKTNHVSGNTCNYFHSCAYFYGDTIIEEDIDTFFKTDSYAYYAYFFKDLEFRGNASAFGRNTNISLANEQLNDGPYQFEIEFFDGGTYQENTNDFYLQVLHNYQEDKPYMKIRELVENHIQFRWRSKSANSDWSDWHTVNKKLYLEAKPSFFVIQELENITENEAKKIIITAEESDFTGELQLHINQGNISPETIIMENGRAEVSVTFDTPQEDAILSVTSREHPLLSGTSGTFTIEHQIQTDFFSVPALTDIRVGEEVHIELIPKEENYTGDISIYLQAEDGTRKRLYAVGRDQSGMYTFPYQAQDEDLGKRYQFFFQDEARPYLQGMSLPFTVLPRKQHHSGGSRVIHQTFFNTDPTTEEANQEGEAQETNETQETNQENETDNSAEQERDQEETEEDNFILENQCLDIHSHYPSLSKRRRHILKSIPEEKQNVKHLQEKLKQLKFLQGNIDGDFGPATQKALQDFQEQHNFSADGIFGRNTSRYIDTHCSNLQEKEEEQKEETEKQENQENGEDKNENTENTDEGNSWFEDVWGGLGNWWNSLFGEEDNDQNLEQDTENEDEQMGEKENSKVMKISREGIEIIASFEGSVDHVYLDAVGKPTIGIGHLIKEGEEFPEKLTKEEILELFENDLNFFVESVNRLILIETSQNEFDAMVSLAYNIGVEAFKKSSVLRYHNNNQKNNAADSFLLWNKGMIHGTLQEIPSLTRRRQKERTLYLGI